MIAAAESARNQGVLSGGIVDRLAGGAAAGAADAIGKVEPGFGDDEVPDQRVFGVYVRVKISRRGRNFCNSREKEEAAKCGGL
jgi:hypothetical protein